ncbi:hypothetical protein FIV42_17550 [Persicimonas caeni]|uniref:Intein C-terminal splicing domain-containing protein n=1 Tax=Persicimonas caeni TaxID=2292766 RepID=A0A4Y6PVX1_PERCE|nr:polymorphic toxin-type HINT domain-containing protein [Persicimonas caeni]QDG52476.1 hypothetical protein FIV42_17550 [Persicimonas caeni]QED33698.1 hypothetical protein FRD00_17545 [Persicimonas caeni]
MCDGSNKPIDEVEEGEWVLARDEKTGAVECRQVVAPYANPERAIIELELVDEQGRVEVIETTDNHPFFVEGQGFTRVDELLLGDRIPSGDGLVLEVERIYLTGRIETVCNFGVDDFRTYFVGQIGAWVHNCYDELRDLLGDMPKEEFERLSKNWNKGNHDTLAESLRYHANKHGGGNLKKYLRQANAFNKRGAKRTKLPNGAVRYNKGNGEFLIKRNGGIVSYGRNNQ